MRVSIALIIAGAALARIAFLLVAPPDAISTDLSHNWLTVASVLHEGGNPYNVTTFLNWPPVWMQLIYLFKTVAV